MWLTQKSLDNEKAWEYIKGFQPEWCISTIYHTWDTPFWLETLNMWQCCLNSWHFQSIHIITHMFSHTHTHIHTHTHTMNLHKWAIFNMLAFSSSYSQNLRLPVPTIHKDNTNLISVFKPCSSQTGYVRHSFHSHTMPEGSVITTTLIVHK